jgi:hypothetical protein
MAAASQSRWENGTSSAVHSRINDANEYASECGCKGTVYPDELQRCRSDSTAGRHSPNGRVSVNLTPDPGDPQVANLRFALSDVWSAPILRAGCEREIHLVSDQDVSLCLFSEESFIVGRESSPFDCTGVRPYTIVEFRLNPPLPCIVNPE